MEQSMEQRRHHSWILAFFHCAMFWKEVMQAEDMVVLTPNPSEPALIRSVGYDIGQDAVRHWSFFTISTLHFNNGQIDKGLSWASP